MLLTDIIFFASFTVAMQPITFLCLCNDTINDVTDTFGVAFVTVTK
jgi:hypothetical protein